MKIVKYFSVTEKGGTKQLFANIANKAEAERLAGILNASRKRDDFYVQEIELQIFSSIKERQESIEKLRALLTPQAFDKLFYANSDVDIEKQMQ